MPGADTRLIQLLQSLPSKIMVGVSGGIDSVSLLHAIVQIGKRPIILHFDHGWRQESKADALWVKKLALSYHLPFYSAKASARIAKTETGAREARDLFFQKAAKKWKCDQLVLAHHADDQVETLLLQLFRGSGSDGFGMSAETQRNGITRLRPWLSVWKKEIQDYAQQHELIWREDSTNQDQHHRRNWIRHTLIPQLNREFQRDVGSLLLRTSLILKDQTEALYQKISPHLKQDKLPISLIKPLSKAEQRLLIKAWLEHHAIPDISFDRVEAIITMVTQANPAKVNLPRGIFARRTSGHLWIDRSQKVDRHAANKQNVKSLEKKVSNT